MYLSKWAENICPYKHLHTDVYSSFIHNCPNVEATKMSFSRWKDKQTAVYPDNGILCRNKKKLAGASLVVQSLRIRLPMQGTWVRTLVWEDPTCRRATKPMRHNYWACALEPACHDYWAHMPQLPKPVCLEPVLCNKRSHCNEKPVHRNKE